VAGVGAALAATGFHFWTNYHVQIVGEPIATQYRMPGEQPLSARPRSSQWAIFWARSNLLCDLVLLPQKEAIRFCTMRQNSYRRVCQTRQWEDLWESRFRCHAGPFPLAATACRRGIIVGRRPSIERSFCASSEPGSCFNEESMATWISWSRRSTWRGHRGAGELPDSKPAQGGSGWEQGWVPVLVVGLAPSVRLSRL